MGIRHVRLSDLDLVAEVHARSFVDDPQMQFLFPDDDTRHEDLLVMFGMIAAAGHRRGHTYLLRDGTTPVAASVWSPPDVESLSDAESEPFVAYMHGRYGDEGLGRLGALVAAMEQHHPSTPHFYLFILGVDPERQGHGLGAQLMAPMLARCDADGTPAYLESSNPRNVPFYERLGFEIRSEFHPEGGPLFTGMWRDPRR